MGFGPAQSAVGSRQDRNASSWLEAFARPRDCSLAARSSVSVAVVGLAARQRAAARRARRSRRSSACPPQIDKIAARRVGSDVYVTLTVPATNIDMSMPADVSRIEVYGYTGLDAAAACRAGPRSARSSATVPVVPAPQPDAGVPPAPPDPNAGAVQGASVTLVDTLTEDELVQGRVDPPLAPPPRRGAAPPVPMPAPAVPLVPPPLRRFYLAIPFSPRGRPGPPGAAAELTLTDIPEPPRNMEVAYSPADGLDRVGAIGRPARVPARSRDRPGGAAIRRHVAGRHARARRCRARAARRCTTCMSRWRRIRWRCPALR